MNVATDAMETQHSMYEDAHGGDTLTKLQWDSMR